MCSSDLEQQAKEMLGSLLEGGMAVGTAMGVPGEAGEKIKSPAIKPEGAPAIETPNHPALKAQGVEAFWSAVEHFRALQTANGRYAAWHASTLKGVRNDHGNFNGRNLLGIDPAAIFREQVRLGAGFRLVQFLQAQPVLARVAVRGAQPAWVRRYPQLVVRNPVAEREGIAGYEFSLAFNGLPSRITPRSARELPGNVKLQLLDVNAAELAQHPCGKMVFKRGHVWTLLPKGQELVDLLTY